MSSIPPSPTSSVHLPHTPGPVDSTGRSLPDPESAWEVRRQAWLARGSLVERVPREAAFAERLRVLESMLLGTSGLSGKDLKGKGKGREVVGEVEGDDGEEEMVDGGEVVGDGVGRNRRRNVMRGSPEGPDELDRTTEGILTSFRQGRILKDALPLSLVTKLLYKSWLLDGTIPKDYIASGSSSNPSISPSKSFLPFAGPTVNVAPPLTTGTIPPRRNPNSSLFASKTIGREIALKGVKRKDAKGMGG